MARQCLAVCLAFAVLFGVSAEGLGAIVIGNAESIMLGFGFRTVVTNNEDGTWTYRYGLANTPPGLQVMWGELSGWPMIVDDVTAVNSASNLWASNVWDILSLNPAELELNGYGEHAARFGEPNNRRLIFTSGYLPIDAVHPALWTDEFVSISNPSKPSGSPAASSGAPPYLLPEPASIAVWSLIGLCSASLSVWRRRRRGSELAGGGHGPSPELARIRWPEENRAAILDMIQRGRP